MHRRQMLCFSYSVVTFGMFKIIRTIDNNDVNRIFSRNRQHWQIRKETYTASVSLLRIYRYDFRNLSDRKSYSFFVRYDRTDKNIIYVENTLLWTKCLKIYIHTEIFKMKSVSIYSKFHETCSPAEHFSILK